MEGDLDTIGLVAFYEETLACSLPLSTLLSLSPTAPLSLSLSLILLHTLTQREGHMGTHRAGSHPPAQRRVLEVKATLWAP